MTNDIYTGAVGVEFRLDTGVDVSEATLIQIKVKKPSSEITAWTATQYGETTKITYTTGADDLDESGVYKLQAYVEWGSVNKHYGVTVEQIVNPLFV